MTWDLEQDWTELEEWRLFLGMTSIKQSARISIQHLHHSVEVKVKRDIRIKKSQQQQQQQQQQQ